MVEPIGIGPYVERASDRIDRYFRDVKREQDALVIGVFGEWGSGKSTLLSAIRQAVETRVAAADPAAVPTLTLTIEFNPWRYEREEHLLVPLLRTAEKKLSDHVDDRDRADAAALAARAPWWRRDLRDLAARWRWAAWVDRRLGDGVAGNADWLGDRLVLLGACTIALTKMVKLKAAVPMLGEVELSPYEALKAAQEQIDRGRQKPAASEQPQGHVSLYYDLFEQLRKLTRGEPPRATDAGAPERGKLNFLFLIDDLDRCLPDKAVEMLEAIKLFLDVAGCVFILALDDEIVERGIAHRYRDYLQLADRGAESIAYSLEPDRYAEFTARVAGTRLPPITGAEYLEKIVQIPFRLPRWSRPEARQFLASSFAPLFPLEPARDGRAAQLTSEATWLMTMFLDAVPLVPRKMVRAAELLEFVRGVAVARKLKLDDYTLAQITLLQLFAPQVFRFLRRNRHAAWNTLQKRVREASLEQPRVDYLSNNFFDWWHARHASAKDGPARRRDYYVETIEVPFIDELRQAANNRSGFDPRRLLVPGMRSTGALEPYFSLFVEAPPADGTRARRVAAPAHRTAFVDFLMGDSLESWTQAYAGEAGLAAATLDDATVAELLQRTASRDPPFTADWLDLLAPHLTAAQLARFVAQRGLVHRLWHAHRADAGSEGGAQPSSPPLVAGEPSPPVVTPRVAPVQRPQSQEWRPTR